MTLYFISWRETLSTQIAEQYPYGLFKTGFLPSHGWLYNAVDKKSICNAKKALLVLKIGEKNLCASFCIFLQNIEIEYKVQN